MRINTNNNVSFQKIYYTNLPIQNLDILPIKANPNHCTIEKKPLAIAKEIMKSSKLFRDLDNSGTDVFVYMGVTDLGKNSKEPLLGVLSSFFKNPYNKEYETLNIQASGFSKETIFEKIKHIADNLPYYNKLEEHSKKSKELFMLKTSNEWFIVEN